MSALKRWARDAAVTRVLTLPGTARLAVVAWDKPLIDKVREEYLFVKVAQDAFVRRRARVTLRRLLPVQRHVERSRVVDIVRSYQRGDRLPPPRVVALSDGLYVWDGHHRVTALRALGRTFVWAFLDVPR